MREDPSQTAEGVDALTDCGMSLTSTDTVVSVALPQLLVAVRE